MKEIESAGVFWYKSEWRNWICIVFQCWIFDLVDFLQSTWIYSGCLLHSYNKDYNVPYKQIHLMCIIAWITHTHTQTCITYSIARKEKEKNKKKYAHHYIHTKAVCWRKRRTRRFEVSNRDSIWNDISFSLSFWLCHSSVRSRFL